MRDVERYFVAISGLGTALEVEAKALAADLGTTAYEERLKLTAGLPAIVLATAAPEPAQALLAKLRARGHRAQSCRASEVVPASAMTSLRRFQFDEDGLDSGSEQLPWSDISMLVCARHQIQAEVTETVKERKFDLGRAVMSGGLITSKTRKREVVTRSEASEQVLYLFRASGDTPWLLRERGTHFSGLGAALEPTATRNFTTAVARFRAHAPGARFDDSLSRRPTITDVDLYAHLLALG